MDSLSSPLPSPLPAIPLRLSCGQVTSTSTLFLFLLSFLLLYILFYLFLGVFAWSLFSPSSAFFALPWRACCWPEKGLIYAGNTKQCDPPILFCLNSTQQHVQSIRENEPLSTYTVDAAVLMGRVKEKTGRGPRERVLWLLMLKWTKKCFENWSGYLWK